MERKVIEFDELEEKLIHSHEIIIMGCGTKRTKNTEREQFQQKEVIKGKVEINA